MIDPGPGADERADVTDDGDQAEEPSYPWHEIPTDEARDVLFLERLRHAGVPKKYMTKTLDHFFADTKVRKELVRAAREYVEYFVGHNGEQIDGVMLRGAVGSGKTHVAVGMLRDILRAGFSGYYCNVPEFLKELRASYGVNTGPDESELIERTREPDVLVLDDLGVEGRVLDPVRDRSKWLCERLYLIVNGRYELDKPIIVTTNCDVPALRDQLDDRTVSRLVEMTRRGFPAFPEQDFRVQRLT